MEFFSAFFEINLSQGMDDLAFTSRWSGDQDQRADNVFGVNINQESLLILQILPNTRDQVHHRKGGHSVVSQQCSGGAQGFGQA